MVAPGDKDEQTRHSPRPPRDPLVLMQMCAGKQCVVQGAKSVQPLLACLYFPPLRAREDIPEGGCSWRDLSMT